MSDGLDERYVGFREHAGLAERVTRLEGRMEALLQMPAQMSELTAQVRALADRLDHRPPPPSEMSNAILALHRGIEAMQQSKPASSMPAMPVMVAIVGAVILASMLLGAAFGPDTIFKAVSGG